MRPRIMTAIGRMRSCMPARRRPCQPRSARARLIERPPRNPALRGSERRSKHVTLKPRWASRVASKAPTRPAPTIVMGGDFIEGSAKIAPAGYRFDQATAIHVAVVQRRRCGTDDVGFAPVDHDRIVLQMLEQLASRFARSLDPQRQLAAASRRSPLAWRFRAHRRRVRGSAIPDSRSALSTFRAALAKPAR